MASRIIRIDICVDEEMERRVYADLVHTAKMLSHTFRDHIGIRVSNWRCVDQHFKGYKEK